MRLPIASLTAALVFAWAAAPVEAAEVSGWLRFTAAPGEANDVTISIDPGGAVRIHDAGAPLTALGDCTQVDAATAVCQVVYRGIADVDLGDRDDRLVLTPEADAFLTNSILDGGDGDDRLVGGTKQRGGLGNDVLEGGPGFSILIGEDGDDVLSGGAGNDSLNGGPGADRMTGGPGTDGVTYVTTTGTWPDWLSEVEGPYVQPEYLTRLEGLAVDPNRPGGDGAPGENDDVAPEVEDIWGGSGNDVLVATTTPSPQDPGDQNVTRSHLVGLGGDDVLVGGPLADFLEGGTGSDVLDGRAGDDALDGDKAGWGGDATGPRELISKDDTLIGGPGNDRFEGHRGKDLFAGGPGNDAIQSWDTNLAGSGVHPTLGADDEVACGEGEDHVSPDIRDGLGECESVYHGPREPRERTLTVAASGLLRLPLRCARESRLPCRGTVRVEVGAARGGGGSFRAPRGGRTAVAVRIPPAARALLARRRSTPGRLIVTRRAPAGTFVREERVRLRASR